MKKLTFAQVLNNKEIALGVYDMELHAPEIAPFASPGQFIMIYTGDEKHILPRPISICDAEKNTGRLRILFKVVGKGTEIFSKLKSGAALKVLGPLGTGFPVKLYKNPIIIGGGIGVPPMLMTAKTFGNQSLVYLGDRDYPVLAKEFSMITKTKLASDTGKTDFKGNAVELAAKDSPTGDVIFACGPRPMLKAASDLGKELKIPVYVSMEERMACGIGACVGCAVSIKKDGHIENLKVCKDGPVFLSSEVFYE